MSRGHNRERQVRQWLEERDYVVVRAAGSLGFCDLIALKRYELPRMIEVKSTAKGPYEHFSPKDRADLIVVATRAGAIAELFWWPPRGTLRIIHSSEWPKLKAAA